MSNAPISEQWHRAALTHCDLESAASLLEETKSAVLSQMMTRLGDMPVARAEKLVKSSPEWSDHVSKIVRARTAANRAKVEVEYIRLKFFEWQSAAATERTQARL